VYNDDCVEVWLDPHNQRRRAYHLIFSVADGVWDGVQWEEASLDPQAPISSARKLARHEDKAWNGTAEAAFDRAEDGWTCEVRVPAADFGLPGVVEGSTWGLNIGRERWAFEEPGRAEYSSLTGTFAWPVGAFAALRLGVSPVEVSNLSLGALGVGESVLRFECRAPRKDLPVVDVRVTARDVEERSVRFTVALDGAKPVTVARTYTLSACPAAKATLELLKPGADVVLFRTSAESDLTSPVRAYPRGNLAFIGPEPWWVDLDLRIGEASLARGRLQVEVRSAAGRVRHRQRLRDLRHTMRLTFKPRAIGPAGEYALRFIVLDGTQELGQAEVPLRLLRPPA